LALPEEKPNPSPNLLSTLLQVVFYLALIVGLIILTVWGVKFIWEKQGWGNLAEPGKPIKVLTTTYLAPRKVIHLVEVGNRLLVVGVGNEEIHCLDVITEKSEVEELRQATQQGFPKIFNRIVKKHEADQEEQETHRIIEEGNQLVGGYVEKLKKISKKKKNTGDNREGDS
jgi:flagellar biogenesis protein FliO